MGQLWFSYLAFGSCTPSLGTFLASNNLAKIYNPERQKIPRQEIIPLDTCNKNLIIRSMGTVEILFYQVHPFSALLPNLGHFGHFLPASKQFLQYFLGSKKVGRTMKIQFHVIDFMQRL